MKFTAIQKNATTVFCVFLAACGLFATSETFQNCERSLKSHKDYVALHEKTSLFIKDATRLKLHVVCSRFTAGENDGAIAAMSGIAVAIFTYTLWRSTEKLWRAAEQQARDMEVSLAAATKSADAAMLAAGSERAWMAFNGYTIDSCSDSSYNETSFEHGIVVSVSWKNVGRSPAIKNDCFITYIVIPTNYPIKPAPELWLQGNTSAPIGPTISASPAGLIIFGPELESILSKKCSLVILTACRYFDVFDGNTVRKSEVCFRLENMRSSTYASLRDEIKNAHWSMRIDGPQNSTT